VKDTGIERKNPEFEALSPWFAGKLAIAF